MQFHHSVLKMGSQIGDRTRKIQEQLFIPVLVLEHDGITIGKLECVQDHGPLADTETSDSLNQVGHFHF